MPLRLLYPHTLLITMNLRKILCISLFLQSLLLTAQPLRVACVGNSVTYGYGIAGRDSLSYPAQLGRMLGTGYDVRNFGHSGTTLLRRGHRPYMNVGEFRAALAFRPDWVIIHLGLNDTDPRNWPQYAEDFIDDYCALVDSFRTVNPKARIWICRMTPIFHGHPRFESGTRDWHAAIQQAIGRVSVATGATLIDLYEPLHVWPNLFPDNLHPNAEGALILARTVRDALTGDYGGLRLAEWLSDGAVLRRNRPITISGMANAGERIEARFLGEKRTATAASDGRWSVKFRAHPAGGPYTLHVEAASRTVEVKNLWLGEVWLCSGQSNMEFTLREAATAAADIRHADSIPGLHLYNMTTLGTPYAEVWDSTRLAAIDRLEYFRPTQWQTCSSDAAASFSAIAYHFGRVLADSLQCPIGLVCNAVGGATTESWIDRTTLEWEYPAILRGWMDNDHIMEWARQRAKYNLTKSTVKNPRHPYEPCYLFEAGMRQLEGLDPTGILWYQGESNADRPELHERLFPWLEQSWRHFFGNDALPFYFVQLSGIGTRPSWPRFRDGQRRMADTLPATYMAVSSDLGDSLNVHPTRKRPVGERLAAAALCHEYDRDVVPSGPQIESGCRQGNALLLTFRYAEGLQGQNGDAIRGFEVAGPDGRFYPATARITRNGLRIAAREVKCPVMVRYAWQAYPHANLVNGAGMPASTFLIEVTEQ